MFDNHLLVLERYENIDMVMYVPLCSKSFWVRIYNIPFNKSSEEISKRLGQLMGDAEGVKMNNSGLEWKDWVRVKVRLNIHKPLIKGAMVHF